MDTRLGGHCLVIGALALSLSACDTADDSYYEEIDEVGFRGEDGGGTIDPGGGGVFVLNGLGAPSVSGIDPAFALNSPDGLSPAVLLADEYGLDTAEYLVECALPAGASVTVTDGVDTAVLDGLVGVAPEWETGACDQDCQEWVSACVLARVNVSEQTVSIWMQADNPAIGYGSPSGAVREATFYGNLFEESDGRYLCKGSGLSVVEAFRDGRTCSFGSGGDCEFTRYADCTSLSRCTLAGPNQDVPANCKTGTLADSNPIHSISTYIVP